MSRLNLSSSCCLNFFLPISILGHVLSIANDDLSTSNTSLLFGSFLDDTKRFKDKSLNLLQNTLND